MSLIYAVSVCRLSKRRWHRFGGKYLRRNANGALKKGRKRRRVAAGKQEKGAGLRASEHLALCVVSVCVPSQW